MATASMQRANTIGVESDPKRRGGAPIIAGTATRVMDIAVRYEVMGMSPDEIRAALPHLSLAQIHTALAYYYAHKRELDRDWKAALRDAARARRRSTSALEQRLGPLADLHRRKRRRAGR
jgi:uncharacterized protein (DUF433 family)